MKFLRPLEPDDLVALNLWRSNRELRDATHGFRYPVSLEIDKSWYQENVVNAPTKKAIFAVQNYEGTFVGLAQLDAIDPIHRHAMLGIYIGEPAERGRGAGKSATIELIEYGFRDLNLRKLFLHVNRSNLSATKLYESLGFTIEGELREHYFHDGDWDDILVMSLFRK